MSDKEWYEGLPGDDFFGKHLQVHMTNGVIYTGPVLADDCLVAMNLCGESRSILERESATSEWRKSPSVVSVSLVWDERDWEQIRTVDISKADAIVVNGRLLHVTRVVHDAFLVGECDPVPVSFVSCALRRRGKLPTNPGYYRDDFGIVFVLISDKSAEWYVLPTESKDSPIPPESVATHLPLTPVHFVDGRAE